VERQRRSVTVQFDDFDLVVDVVIARPCVDHADEHWQIPERTEEDGRASWRLWVGRYGNRVRRHRALLPGTRIDHHNGIPGFTRCSQHPT
jgi:hypothetical protein